MNYKNLTLNKRIDIPNKIIQSKKYFFKVYIIFYYIFFLPSSFITTSFLSYLKSVQAYYYFNNCESLNHIYLI